MAAQNITSDELMDVTVANPTKRNLISWAFEKGIPGYEQMKDFILREVLELRGRADAGYLDPEPPAPEFLDGIPPMEEPPQGALATDEPMTELPRKPMD